MKKKILLTIAILACAALLVAGSVLGTVAYLTARHKVVNTFTYGSVVITMDETNVNEDGKATEGRNNNGNTYKLIPGKTYDKDPIIHVTAGSEECYLILKLDNYIGGLDAVEKQDENTVAKQLVANGWTYDETNAVYYYGNEENKGTIVDASAAAKDVATFATFTTESDGTDWLKTGEVQITVTAYAVQVEGFDSALEAYNNAFGTPNP